MLINAKFSCQSINLVTFSSERNGRNKIIHTVSRLDYVRLRLHCFNFQIKNIIFSKQKLIFGSYAFYKWILV